MNCPRCENVTLNETQREGISIDPCPRCRGIWLDRGELEKLIHLTNSEVDQLFVPPERARFDRPALHQEDYRYDRARYEQDYRPRDQDDYKYRHKRKKTWVESLGDIFD
ncbi:MAG: zf-TFIIB domain-containing protein [Polyangiaceae bacterium]|nr:zf-TFIIB domain-containing protein [Polyangiaceae bacterium]